MLWSDFDYTLQMDVIEKLYQLIVKEEDPKVRRCLEAAAHELDTWSNHPCDIDITEGELSDEEYVAVAQDNYMESNSDSFLSMIFGKK